MVIQDLLNEDSDLLMDIIEKDGPVTMNLIMNVCSGVAAIIGYSIVCNFSSIDKLYFM